MTAAPDLQVRLYVREALTRVSDASSATDDHLIVARLKTVMKDLEDILAHLTPDPTPLHRGDYAWASPRR